MKIQIVKPKFGFNIILQKEELGLLGEITDSRNRTGDRQYELGEPCSARK